MFHRWLIVPIVVGLIFAVSACMDDKQSENDATRAGLPGSVALAQRAVANATVMGPIPWTGPTTGPAAPTGKKVIYIAFSLTNGGIAGAARGAQEAANLVGWQLSVVDAGGTTAGAAAAISAAVKQKPDGIILGGIDAASVFQQLNEASRKDIRVVGWHAAANAGYVPGMPIFFNVATDTGKVAQLAAQYAIARTEGKAKVVIFTDDSVPIAKSKAQRMRNIIETCKGCKVLAYEDIPLSDAGARVPQRVPELLAQFGAEWTDTLAINDVYFDAAAPILRQAGMPPEGPPANTSAGDGSESAFERIRQGQYQSATIPEPLNEQGWQLIDELNRSFAVQKASGYVAQLRLITKDTVGAANTYEPGDDYRANYTRIWKP